MNELLTNTLTVTFEGQDGVLHSNQVCATVEIVDGDAVPAPDHLENIASNHK